VRYSLLNTITTSTVNVAAKVKKRNDLTLQQKVSVIKAHLKGPQPSVRQLAEQFDCGKTQISTILQNKAEISRLTVVSREAKKGQSDCQKQNVRRTTVCLLHERTFSSFDVIIIVDIS